LLDSGTRCIVERIMRPPTPSESLCGRAYLLMGMKSIMTPGRTSYWMRFVPL
jgi:hypothetical protein